MQDCPCRKEENSKDNEEVCSIYCKLPRFNWYWGNITRLEVEVLLLKYPDYFIIRACNDTDHIICVSFRLNPCSRLKGNSSFSHMGLKHYKGLFSLDNKDYVPVEKIPQHCERVGKEMELFDATALIRNESTILEMSKIFCRREK